MLPLLGLVAGGLGGIVGGTVGAWRADVNTRRSRRFIERMRGSAYQATMADMRLAGLNPILAHGQGPTSTGTGPMTQNPDFGANISSGLQAGASATKAGAQKRLTNAQVLGTNATTKKTASDELLSEQKTDESLSALYANLATAREVNARAEHLENTLPASRAAREVDETKGGKRARKLRRLIQPIRELIPFTRTGGKQ